MSDALRNLTRKQLGLFLPDPRAVRAFEQMLKQLADLIPADLENISNGVTTAQTTADQAKIAAEAAQQTADIASEGLTLAAQALAMLAQMSGLDLVEVAPPTQPAVKNDDLDGALTMAMQIQATLGAGASGTFKSGDVTQKTISVQNGIITGIV